MSLSEDLSWRGLIKDKTFDDISWLDEPKSFYLGIDASDSSFTIGNLAVIMLARRLLDAGWQATLLAGGATSLVGDPGGKEEERELKSREEISANIEGIKSQFEKLFSGKPHELVNNLDWLDGLKYLDFLRDVGKHFSMTDLMQREFVDARMGERGSGISYAEFSYSLLQGYDFWWLFKNKGVVMQIGASDQWGNMLSGVQLIRKMEGKEANSFSMPLVIDKSTGRKFGKSEAGAVWLDANRTSVFKFYQFWINSSDDDVEEFLKIFTVLQRDEIEKIMSTHNTDPSNRIAQKRLAYEVTKIVHGEEQSLKQKHITESLFIKGDLSGLNESDLATIREEFPHYLASNQSTVIGALVSTGLVHSNSEARRLIDIGAIYVNGRQCKRENFESSDFQKGKLLLRRGKAFKDSALIELNN